MKVSSLPPPPPTNPFPIWCLEKQKVSQKMSEECLKWKLNCRRIFLLLLFHISFFPSPSFLFLTLLLFCTVLFFLLPFHSYKHLLFSFIPLPSSLPFNAFSQMANMHTPHVTQQQRMHAARHVCKHGQNTHTGTNRHTGGRQRGGLPESGVREWKWERAVAPRQSWDMNTLRGSAGHFLGGRGLAGWRLGGVQDCSLGLPTSQTALSWLLGSSSPAGDWISPVITMLEVHGCDSVW